METDHDKIVTLLVEEGKNPGQPVAGYGSGRSRCLVFMPSAAPVGKSVRIRLQDTGKLDSRGKILYRGVPAPVEDVFRYRDNGNGTVAMQLYARDWLGQEVLAAEEERPLAAREGAPSTKEVKTVKWGMDLASSVVEISQVQATPIETEFVVSGQLVWKRTGEREVLQAVNSFPLIEIVVYNCQWQPRRLDLVYEDIWQLNYGVRFKSPDNLLTFSTTWGEMPSWWRAGQEVLRPVCACGRKRREQQEDGFDRCELCRAESTCGRCGKQTRAKVISGHLVCANCEPYEKLESEIAAAFSVDARKRIAAEATALLAGQAMPYDLGYMVLKGSLGHVRNESDRSRILTSWNDYSWYYFCESGVYGSKFDPSALQLLQYLPQALGNGLVDMVAWFVGDHNGDPGMDQYVQSQIHHRDGLPDCDSMEAAIRGLGGGILGAALKLRDSEADRLKALEVWSKLQAYTASAETNSKLRQVLDNVRNLLESEDQRYSEVVAKASQAEAAAFGAQRLQQLIETEYFVCPSCGKEWAERRGEKECYCLSDQGGDTSFTIRTSTAPSETGMELAVVKVIYDHETDCIRLVTGGTDIPDLSYVVTEQLWVPPTEAEWEVREELRQAVGRFGNYDAEAARVGEGGRLLLKWELDTAPDRKGKLFAIEAVGKIYVIERQGDGSEQTVEKSGLVRFVCDPARCGWLDVPPKAGESWSCTTKRVIGQDKAGRPIVVANPQMRVDEKERRKFLDAIGEVKDQIRRVRSGKQEKPETISKPEINISGLGTKFRIR